MQRSLRIGVKTVCLAYFFSSFAAIAQQRAPGGTGNAGVDLRGLTKVSRSVENTFPVAQSPQLTISNRYGEIRVNAWDSRLVRVVARITVGAEDGLAAEEFANRIEIEAEQDGDRIRIETHYPEVTESDRVGYYVDYRVSVPADTTVFIDNFFGDSFVRDLTGPVTIEARYGVVELRNLTAPVRVRAKGEYPLIAEGLFGGGTFSLRSTQATFKDVGGTLRANNYLGSIEVRLPAETVDMDLTAESGPIHFYLPEDARVDLDVVATHGTIESEIPLERDVWGESVHGRSVGDGATMRIALQTSFNTIYIHQEGLRAPVEPLYPADAAPIERVLHETYPVAPGTVLSVHGMAGNITVRGTDRKDIAITATQRVRVLAIKNAQVALEGLGLQIRERVGTFEVRTSVLDDLEALGCIDYQVDLVVEYPRELPVNIYAEDGNTSVQGARGEVRIDQARGIIRAHDTDGTLHLTNRLGDIEVTECAGNLVAATSYGTVTVRNIAGDLHITTVQGKTVVDAPGAGVTVRNTGGDVRLVALAGIRGDFDIDAEDGDISLAVASDASATFWLSARGGSIHSSVPVTGTMDRSVQTFQGRLNAGTYRVVLNVRRGNIIID